jgi:hypothetical protein
MTLAGGLTFAGLIIAIAVPSFMVIVKIADAFAGELRVLVAAFAAVPGDDAAHDHAADSDLPSPVHGALVEAETTGCTSGKIRKFAVGGSLV